MNEQPIRYVVASITCGNSDSAAADGNGRPIWVQVVPPLTDLLTLRQCPCRPVITVRRCGSRKSMLTSSASILSRRADVLPPSDVLITPPWAPVHFAPSQNVSGSSGSSVMVEG